MGRTPSLAVAAAVASLALVLGACTGGGDDPQPSGTSGQSTTAGGEDATLRSVADQVLRFSESEGVAQGEGTIKGRGSETTAATAEVVKMIAGSDSASLLFKISTPEEFRPDNGFLEADQYGSSADGVTITAGDTMLYADTYEYGGSSLAQACVCSRNIESLGPDGIWVSVLFGALPEGTTTVGLNIPGFKAIDVPVTRE